MRWDLTEESNHESIEVPFYLPRLFVSPSCLPKFSKTIEEVASKKAKLLNKTIDLQKAMHMNDQKRVEELDNKCACLRLEIESLESEANEMRMTLVQRIYVVVNSVEEMRAVNELWCGTGAPLGMRCFRGKIYVPENVEADVIKAMVHEARATTCGLKIQLSELECLSVTRDFYRVRVEQAGSNDAKMNSIGVCLDRDGRRRQKTAAIGGADLIPISWPHDSYSPASHSPSRQRLTHSHRSHQPKPTQPSNHPSDFTFLPLSDNLPAIENSDSFIDFINILNSNCRPSFQEYLTRLISEGNKSIVVVFDNVMHFAGVVAVDLNLAAVLFRSTSAAYFPAFLARQQLRQQGRFLEQDFVMQEIVPNHYPLRYKDLPFPITSVEDWKQLVANFNQQTAPSAVVWNTIKFLEQESLTLVQNHYQVPVFAAGPLHKITPSPSVTCSHQEDTGCITWLDKQPPKSVNLHKLWKPSLNGCETADRDGMGSS
ncbi:hypothetical protein R6Q57_017808 [Mikania cordata]